MKIHDSLPLKTTALALLIVVLGACASTPVPSEKLAVAEAAVERANNDSTNLNAPGELQIAIAKLASARQAVANEDYERAGRLADQAVIDARVAELHAESVRSEKAAQESQAAARALRDEINRTTQ